jgi:hypothetical protein
MRDTGRKPDDTPVPQVACEAAHGGRKAGALASPHLHCSTVTVEVFLLIWDEMDDWVGACKHLLRRLT